MIDRAGDSVRSAYGSPESTFTTFAFARPDRPLPAHAGS